MLRATTSCRDHSTMLKLASRREAMRRRFVRTCRPQVCCDALIYTPTSAKKNTISIDEGQSLFLKNGQAGQVESARYCTHNSTVSSIIDSINSSTTVQYVHFLRGFFYQQFPVPPHSSPSFCRLEDDTHTTNSGVLFVVLHVYRVFRDVPGCPCLDRAVIIVRSYVDMVFHAELPGCRNLRPRTGPQLVRCPSNHLLSAHFRQRDHASA